MYRLNPSDLVLSVIDVEKGMMLKLIREGFAQCSGK